MFLVSFLSRERHYPISERENRLEGLYCRAPVVFLLCFRQIAVRHEALGVLARVVAVRAIGPTLGPLEPLIGYREKNAQDPQEAKPACARSLT